MLSLGTNRVEFTGFSSGEGQAVFRVTTSPTRPRPLRGREVFVVRNNDVPEGFAVYLATRSQASSLVRSRPGVKLAVVPDELGYLDDGDVIRLQPDRGSLRVLYRRRSPHNSFLLTERCNHYCLMCSQPPRNVDDGWIVDEVLQAIPLIDPATVEIGLTGGEPTLLGNDLIRILAAAKNYLPNTSVHILSNGRRFADAAFAAAYASVRHPDVMVGIPIYADISTVHDYVVQADGAFDETIRGILNLKRYRQKIEIRVVIHKQTCRRLEPLAEFLARNLTFVDHVALMGLEMTGFTRANLAELWVDPVDYRSELYRATSILHAHRMNVSIYNHQLCVIDQRLRPFARKSISDWKNEYMPECTGCTQRDACGGFFASARLRYSDHIRPFT